MADKMLRIPAWYFIIYQFISLAIALACSFSWATELGHVEKLFPYISYAGAYPPESCVFSFFMVIFSVSTLFAMCVRWKVVSDKTLDGTGCCCSKKCACDEMTNGTKCCLNTAAFVVGIIADVGVLIVATFQVTNQYGVHWVGAFLTFAGGIVYMLLQTIISCGVQTVPRCGTHKCLWITRSVLSALATSSAIAFICVAIASTSARDTVDKDSIKWHSREKGYELHVAAAFLELTVVVMFILFFLSFSCEFANLNLEWSVAVGGDGKGDGKVHPETDQVQRQTGSVNGGFAVNDNVAENGIDSQPQSRIIID